MHREDGDSKVGTPVWYPLVPEGKSSLATLRCLRKCQNSTSARIARSRCTLSGWPGFRVGVGTARSGAASVLHGLPRESHRREGTSRRADLRLQWNRLAEVLNPPLGVAAQHFHSPHRTLINHLGNSPQGWGVRSKRRASHLSGVESRWIPALPERLTGLSLARKASEPSCGA